MRFEELGIRPEILQALREEQYEKPSPIQEKAIPPALAGRDVLGCAQTGTGKTAAFAVPALQRLSGTPAAEPGLPHALVLTPTRELALQIAESFAAYGRHLPLRCTAVFGGVSQAPQVEALRAGCDILVATPGRLWDLFQQKLVSFGGVGIFVLDEADRMLDMGFWPDVKRLLAVLPREKQTMLFSATMPEEIRKLASSLLTRPVRASAAPQATPVEKIAQCVYFVEKPEKSPLLIHLLRDPAVTSALVFTRTKHGADRVARHLSRAGIPALAIHGDKSQGARQRALASFKSRALRVLVATDIAARGLDIEELSHVFNYDLPNIPETYVHRIGRTGRAGLSGVAVSFCAADERPYLSGIESLTGRCVPARETPPLEPLAAANRPQENPAKKSRENPGENPAKHPHGDPGKKSQAHPSNISRKNPAKKNPEHPVEKGRENPVKKPHENHEKNPVKNLPRTPAEKPADMPRRRSTEDAIRAQAPQPAPPKAPPQRFIPSHAAKQRPSDQPLSGRRLEPVLHRKG